MLLTVLFLLLKYFVFITVVNIKMYEMFPYIINKRDTPTKNKKTKIYNFHQQKRCLTIL